jgi:hypothetical protein
MTATQSIANMTICNCGGDMSRSASTMIGRMHKPAVFHEVAASAT